ncbi:MAG: hypothetical protein WB723_16565, partial [Candidatus Acidiferrales bacterium]
RKLYKRFFSVTWTFSITRFSTFFRKTDFFNSHSSSHQLSENEKGGDNPVAGFCAGSATIGAKDSIHI